MEDAECREIEEKNDFVKYFLILGELQLKKASIKNDFMRHFRIIYQMVAKFGGFEVILRKFMVCGLDL